MGFASDFMSWGWFGKNLLTLGDVFGLYGGIVADIAFLAWISFSPLSSCTSEEGDIEKVGFVSIDKVFLFAGEFWRNKVLLYGIRMDI